MPTLASMKERVIPYRIALVSLATLGLAAGVSAEVNLSAISEVIQAIVDVVPDLIDLVVGIVPIIVVISLVGFIVALLDKIISMMGKGLG